jgi:(2R)-ethylmalonyl-CoA mutase
MTSQQTQRDKPWIFRTYAGHSTAKESNALYRSNLAKGQSGLSVAFDLPTQTGYDPDHVLAKGEVGKVGVSIAHLGDMRLLFDQIPLDAMNTSMTINATAPWLLALYVALADEQDVDRSLLSGTTQNDLIKEYLSRGTYVFPPEPSMRLTRDVIAWTYQNTPKWNPMNVCSYHLQEAGATPVQELSFALATAIAVLDTVRESSVISDTDFPKAVSRLSFFVNAGMRFVTEVCKMRAFTELWDEICEKRYGIDDPKLRRFRYGVQVNSLGLTEQQPENNVSRILIEMLSVVLSKNARARAVQLPAWNEALGLPRPFDQQWSLRMQQIMAFETDLLEHGDIFDGSSVITAKVEALKTEAREEIRHIESLGGAIAAVELGYMKQQLVRSNTARIEAIESGETTVVGVNAYTTSEPSPLATGEKAIMTVADHVEPEAIASIQAWRSKRDDRAVARTLADLKQAARENANIMEPSIACAKAGVTTGEWADVFRSLYGEYRAPTGISSAARNDAPISTELLDAVDAVSRQLGERLKMLVGKPGLDGHSNGAEQIAVRARDAGIQVIYQGIRLTPKEIVKAAKDEGVHLIGLSILSGSHVALVQDVMQLLRQDGLDHIPVVVGGIIPPADEMLLKEAGVLGVFTPKDFRINEVLLKIVHLLETEKA